MRVYRVACCVTMLACSAPAGARAQGFQLNEIGTCAVGRGQAVTGAPCKDPSVIYWNPSAASTLAGWSAYVGVSAIALSGNFTADTTGRIDKSNGPISPVPHVFINYGSKDGKWAAGFGAYVPYGLTSQWKNDFPGRFAADKAALTTVYFQPNVAYQFAPGWSIGGGPVFGYSRVELRQALDLAQQFAIPNTRFGQLGVPAGTEFAYSKLSGSGTAWGFNLGVYGTLGADWEVGARYLSKLTFDYTNADATFTQTPTGLTLAAGNPFGLPAGTPVDQLLAPFFASGGTLSPQKVSTRITHPAQFEVGLGYTGFVNTTLSADFEWTQFSSFDKLPVTFSGPAATVANRTIIEDYNNSWSIRAGVEHAFAIGLKGRAGFDFVRTPAPDFTVTPLLPDMDRRNYTLGLGFPLSPHYTIDAGYLHVDTSGRRGRIVEPPSGVPPTTALNSGFYELSANVFSLSIRANF